MNNENKKAKFNVIDLVVIVIVVLAIAFVGYKLLPIGDSGEQIQKVRISYFMEECPSYVPQHTQIGDLMYDGDKETLLGFVTEVRSEEALTYELNETTGEMVPVKNENYCAVYITGEVDAVMTEHGPLVGETLYGIGHTIIVHAGMGKYYAKVYDVQVVE